MAIFINICFFLCLTNALLILIEACIVDQIQSSALVPLFFDRSFLFAHFNLNIHLASFIFFEFLAMSPLSYFNNDYLENLLPSLYRCN